MKTVNEYFNQLSEEKKLKIVMPIAFKEAVAEENLEDMEEIVRLHYDIMGEFCYEDFGKIFDNLNTNEKDKQFKAFFDTCEKKLPEKVGNWLFQILIRRDSRGAACQMKCLKKMKKLKLFHKIKLPEVIRLYGQYDSVFFSSILKSDINSIDIKTWRTLEENEARYFTPKVNLFIANKFLEYRKQELKKSNKLKKI